MEKSESKESKLKLLEGISFPPYSQHYHDLAMKNIELQADWDRWKKPSIWHENISKEQMNGQSTGDNV